MLRFILVRHGQTIENKGMRLSGFIDSKLSEDGKIQIQKTAVRLKDEKIDVIYSSPLSRSLDTAHAINKYHNKDIKICDNFKEMNFGDFEGYTFKEINDNYSAEFEKLKNDAYFYKFPNGESTIDFHNRASKQIDEIIKTSGDETILIVAHSGIIRSIMSHLLSSDYKYYWNFKIDNCSISVVEFVDEFAVVCTSNNIEHLK